MSVQLSDLKWYGSATMPEDNTTTNIGGAIDSSKKMQFADVNGLVQAVSSAPADTTQTVTVSYRDSGGALQTLTVTLNGTTPVVYAPTMERLLKAVKSGSTSGTAAVEAQTATRTGTAQTGDAYTITLDAGASAVDETYTGQVIRLTGGTGANQIREIIKYTGATKQAWVSYPWATNPDGTTTFRVAPGMVFDKTPNEIIQVRRVFYNAAANAPGGGAINYYDKVFAGNFGTSGSALLSAQVAEVANPSGDVSFGLAASQNDTGGNGAGNNRTVAPAGIVFGTATLNVPTNQITQGSSIGVWLQLALADGNIALKSSVTPQLLGSTV